MDVQFQLDFNKDKKGCINIQHGIKIEEYTQQNDVQPQYI